MLLYAGLVSGSDERVVVALEELTDLKGVWSELSKVWEKIEELKEKPWLSVAPRKIRQALDALVQQLRGFPTRLKSYASFEYVQATLKGYAKVHRNVYLGEWEQAHLFVFCMVNYRISPNVSICHPAHVHDVICGVAHACPQYGALI